MSLDEFLSWEAVAKVCVILFVAALAIGLAKS